MAFHILLHWRKQFAGRSEAFLKVKEIQAARARPSDIEAIQAACALYCNWLRPSVVQQEPRILDALDKLEREGKLIDELARVAAGRSSADLASGLALEVVPS
eukprot:5599596-Alexandrium_andersonii.AAC.1